MKKKAKDFSDYMKDKKEMSDAEVPSYSAEEVLNSLPPLKCISAFWHVPPVIWNCSFLGSILNSSTVVSGFKGLHINVFLEKF